MGLGPGRRRRRAGLGHRQVVGGHGLGLGDDRGLVLGVGVEQRVHRREVVDVVRQGQPRGGVVRFGPRGRRRDRGLDGGEVDLVDVVGRG